MLPLMSMRMHSATDVVPLHQVQFQIVVPQLDRQRALALFGLPCGCVPQRLVQVQLRDRVAVLVFLGPFQSIRPGPGVGCGVPFPASPRQVCKDLHQRLALQRVDRLGREPKPPRNLVEHPLLHHLGENVLIGRLEFIQGIECLLAIGENEIHHLVVAKQVVG